MKPNELIKPYRDRLSPRAVVAYLRENHLGYSRRIKVRDLCAQMLTEEWEHGKAPDVALRNVVSELVQAGAPIASESGPTGGVYWIATEDERKEAITTLRLQIDSLTQRELALTLSDLKGYEYKPVVKVSPATRISRSPDVVTEDDLWS